MPLYEEKPEDTIKPNRVGGYTKIATASFTRPNDTTPYNAGDLIANNTTANLVVPMVFDLSRVPGAGGMIRRLRLRKSSANLVNASFRLHLYASLPTIIQNGDNGIWRTNNAMDYVGAYDVIMDRIFTDGAVGNGLPLTGSEDNFVADRYWGLLEARAGYTPIANEGFTGQLEVIQN
jgi:hypothetical protein